MPTRPKRVGLTLTGIVMSKPHGDPDRLAHPELGGTVGAVATSASLDDERGVDRAQIRELLALSPSERVDRLIATVSVWMQILSQSGSTKSA